jgi:hypothetical protein
MLLLLLLLLLLLWPMLLLLLLPVLPYAAPLRRVVLARSVLSFNLANAALKVVLLKRQGSARSTRVTRVARVTSRVTAHRTVRADLPKPRLVVDDLDFLAGQDASAGLGSQLRLVPAQVNKHALKLVAVVRLARNHVNAFDEADAEVLEAGHNTLTRNVLEDARDAKTGHIRGKCGQVHINLVVIKRRHFELYSQVQGKSTIHLKPKSISIFF